MQRKNLQPTFLDAQLAELGSPKTQAFFDKVQTLFDFAALAVPLEDLFKQAPGAGRPHWSVELMLRCILLQKWFGLSDSLLEEMLRDRISFRRFVGLSMSDATPDETTFCVFRKRLLEAQKLQGLFALTLQTLKDKGLVLNEGTLVDATIIDAPLGHKRFDGTSTRDPGATFTKNHGTLRHGYKAHIATEVKGLITDYIYDTAKPHDSRHIDQLTEKETRAVYADSAYRDQKRTEALANRGTMAMIVSKKVRGQKDLTPEQKRFNRTCSVVRAAVEHPRAWMSKMGFLCARYRGLAKNALDFGLTAIAYNLKRSLSLLGHPLTRPRPHRSDRLPLHARVIC